MTEELVILKLFHGIDMVLHDPFVWCVGYSGPLKERARGIWFLGATLGSQIDHLRHLRDTLLVDQSWSALTL